nr:CU044_2847 family protein [Methylorubrum populi]
MIERDSLNRNLFLQERQGPLGERFGLRLYPFLQQKQGFLRFELPDERPRGVDGRINVVAEIGRRRGFGGVRAGGFDELPEPLRNLGHGYILRADRRQDLAQIGHGNLLIPRDRPRDRPDNVATDHLPTNYERLVEMALAGIHTELGQAEDACDVLPRTKEDRGAAGASLQPEPGGILTGELPAIVRPDDVGQVALDRHVLDGARAAGHAPGEARDGDGLTDLVACVEGELQRQDTSRDLIHREQDDILRWAVLGLACIGEPGCRSESLILPVGMGIFDRDRIDGGPAPGFRRHPPDMAARRHVGPLDQHAAPLETLCTVGGVDVDEALLDHFSNGILAMSARMVVELPDGNKVLFGRDPDTGLGEIGIGDDITTKSQEQFKKALTSLAGLVKAMEETVGALARRPDAIEMEFGAKLTGECDLWIVSGETEAEFKVTLKWGKPD